ncbi:tricarboxylate transporter [Photobacterium sp. BZF1]|uniref:Bug family tripartite tricarboxylate transporter substrate binding protein n=1 Tax=Photobacterium sp. BZF1 TaxID=1904457 RepID=UPI0016538372|nr:tricarboxylate transporter [Photobacterium sp. BZF1]MBC7001073.1 tricarboxylate transporter [Photobacterium sp. BZF1]
MNKFKRLISGVFIAAISIISVSAPAVAKTDFSGKRIEWVIPFKEGGGTDRWARFIAPYLTDALPGQPAIVIKNMPGGSSIKGANFFQKRARKDGLMLLGTSGTTQLPWLLDDKRVRYDYLDWEAVFASPSGGVVYVNPELNIDTAEKLANTQSALTYGSQGPTSLDLIPLLAFELLGMDVKPVFGMTGKGAARLAFERGEVNLDYQTSSAYLSKVTPLVEEGKAVPLMSWGALDSQGNLIRDPSFPGLPHFAEVYESIHGKAPSGPAFEAWKAFFIPGFPAQKLVLLPKNADPEVIATYKAAFEKIANNPEFIQASKLALGAYTPATGDNIGTLYKQATAISKDDQAWVQAWLKERFNARF